jgi:hypothetical protein
MDREQIGRLAGFIMVRTMAWASAQVEDYFFLTTCGPKGGKVEPIAGVEEHYHAISRETAQKLVIGLIEELARDARHRNDSATADFLLQAGRRAISASDETRHAIAHNWGRDNSTTL